MKAASVTGIRFDCVTNPRQIFTLDFFRSGGVFYGGFLAAVVASVIIMRLYHLPWWRSADVFAPGIAIGQAIGRLGCFSAGCCWGKPTTAAWGVHFSERGHEITGVPTMVDHLTDAAQREIWLQKLGGPFAALSLHPTQPRAPGTGAVRRCNRRCPIYSEAAG